MFLHHFEFEFYRLINIRAEMLGLIVSLSLTLAEAVKVLCHQLPGSQIRMD